VKAASRNALAAAHHKSLHSNPAGWRQRHDTIHAGNLVASTPNDEPMIGADARTRVFHLAPMSPRILWLTVGAWAIPLALFIAAFSSSAESDWMLLALLLIGVYGAIWLWWRPVSFELRPTGLDVVFPGRRRSISLHRVTGARVISEQDFRQEFGRAMRIGVGGLWGGYGWLWTKRGLIDFYVSRTDGLVLIERASSRPLLVTPDEPDEMVEALESLVQEPRSRNP